MTKRDNGTEPWQLPLWDDGTEMPGRPAPIVRRNGDDIELVELSWGLKPRRPGSRPIINLRAEGRSFPDRRCLLPASEFFLRDRTPSRAMWRISLANDDLFYLAGLWRPAEDDWPESFAVLTTATGSDLQSIKDRQMAVVLAEQRMGWLDGLVPQAELLRPLPLGTFRIERAKRVAS